MKNRNFIKNSIMLLLPISMGIGVLFGTSNKPVEEVSAYTKDGTLTTTIDLRDNTTQEIKNYYSSLSDLSSSQLQGNNLLKNLKPILKNGQKYFAYDSSGDDLWKMYEIIDRDWEKSPASAITGYSASTNKITGYKYGTSTSNKGTNPYIHALYVDRSVENETRAWDDHQQTQWGINREHIWPKSQGFDTGGAGGARGDPMHLWAGNGRVNGTEHNNNMYGFVDKSKSYTNPYDEKKFKNLKDNYSGKSLTVPSSTDTVFEPQDSDKGDIARAIFYMVARYNNLAGNDTIDTNNPNLALQQTTKALSSYTTTSSNKQTGYMGLMTDLLYWNHLDPVDEFEIHRNNLLFNNYTHNRNPFIDYPEWADYIWGKPVYNGRNYVSYSSTPTGSVNLSTDVINGFKGEQPQQVTVTSIEVTTKPDTLVYNVGETLDTTGMVVKAHMSNNTTKVLSSSEYTVAPSGALKTSDTQATVTYEGKTASFAIAVKGSGGGGQTQTASIVASDYEDVTFPTADKSFNIVSNKNGGSTDPTYNGTGKDIRLYAKATFVVTSNVGNMSEIIFNISAQGLKRQASITASVGTITYDIANSVVIWRGDSNEVTLTVGEKADYGTESSKAGQFDFLSLDITYGGSGSSSVDVTSITLNKNSTTFEIGQSDSLIATIAPEDASIKLVSWSSSDSAIAEVNDGGEITAKSAGTATITCSALDGSGVTATCTVTVNAPVVLTSISLSGQYATEFYLGDTFSTEGMTVMANYSDGSEIDITDDIEISGYDTNTSGIQTVTISYGGISTTYTIEVKEKGLDDNQLMFNPSQYGLVNGDDLTSYAESIATLTFNKNSGSQPKFYTSSMSFRIYAKNSFTIVGTKNITKIEFEMSSGDTVGNNAITANIGNFSNNVWTGESNSITFSVGGTSGQRNIVSIKVTYELQSEDVVVLQSISASGTYKTEFFVGESFTYEGLVVTAYYSDETSKEVTPTSVSNPTMSTAGQKTVTVTYTEKGITKDATYSITVTAVITTSIELTGNYKTTFIQGEEYDPTGMRITEYYNNGGHSAAHYPTSQGCTITGYDKDEIGEQTIKVDWNGVYTTYNVNVIARPSAKVTEEGAEGYYLVSGASTLTAGDKLMIVGIDSDAYYALAPFVSGNNCKRNDIPTPTNNYFESSAAYLTLGGSAGNWTLFDGTHYLYAAGGTSEKNNYLKGAENANDLNAQWSISISDSKATIVTADSTVVKNTIKHNTSSDCFSCYSTPQADIYLYRYEKRSVLTEYFASINLTKAIMSAQSILDTACGAKNVTKANWKLVKDLITPFLSDTTSADYNALMFGEAKSSELQGNILEDFLARYDLIADLYGYDKFITVGDVSRNTGVIRKASINIETNPTAIVVMILATTGLISIGSYFFFRRRKED